MFLMVWSFVELKEKLLKGVLHWSQKFSDFLDVPGIHSAKMVVSIDKKESHGRSVVF